jgi:S1-C subfamily serine protease
LVATARHVVSSGPCLVDGAKARVVGGVPGRDFALLRIKAVVIYRALIDCSGIHEGQAYLATGFAEDAPRTVTQRLIGTSAKSDEKGFEGETVMRGSITQGMSGGPVVDASTGALVAIINANSGDGVTQSLVFPISETPLCRR